MHSYYTSESRMHVQYKKKTRLCVKCCKVDVIAWLSCFQMRIQSMKRSAW